MIIFCCDYFAKDKTGGAELTTQVLIDHAPSDVLCLNAIDVDKNIIDQYKNNIWVFGNFARLKYSLLEYIQETLKYFVIEFDYKFCLYRSIEQHKATESADCNCHLYFGKNIADFYLKSLGIFWMSHAQKHIYFDRFPFLREANNEVLSSCFSEESLDLFKKLRKNKKSDKWFVHIYGSWVKGVDQSAQYCKDNHLKMRSLIGKVDYRFLLEEISKCKGVVFLPQGADTCPRYVIEAVLLGCDVVINENVQHKDEPWFLDRSIGKIEKYLRSRPGVFWSEVTRREKDVCILSSVEK